MACRYKKKAKETPKLLFLTLASLPPSQPFLESLTLGGTEGDPLAPAVGLLGSK